MKRKLIIIIAIFVALVVGCGTSNKIDISKYNLNESDNVKSSENVKEDNINIEEEEKISIDKIFPEEIGFGWIYSGTLDYGRTEKITKCYIEDNVKHIIVEGEEDDLSDGESGKDFTFTKDYQITADGIILNHTGSPEYLDGKKYYLLKTPLEIGNSWEHEWYYGSKAKTEIIEVTDNNIITETKIIEDIDNEDYYFTKTKITYEKGKGVIAVDKVGKEEFTITENLYVSGLDYLKEHTNNINGVPN
ncbi:hypothetical protein SH1V18_37110 [Vallitalea longa]|uniref:Lipoprotein n=1 Tax=Vallitalea longa TaxID=2936439 RepID=A0A9W6DFH6_9FIRM|nr:hypothetical protein [Vallitalea longa]GKX31231.1 hypothetical protein SH1V18_37110 [Vallitalea longa]